jgi:acyl-CoA synthetase (AMP-forming)/AMP-acid ligase II/aryl carrier-like protein
MTDEVAPPGSRTVLGLLRESVQRWPDRDALSAPGRAALTYRALLDQVERMIAHLHESGIGQNDRVAVVLPNGPEMATAFLATAGGATSAPLNPGYRASEFEFYLTDLEAKALIALDGSPSPAVDVAGSLGIPVMWLTPSTAGAAGLCTLSRVTTRRGALTPPAPDAEALVLHTSGTTSRPKLVPLTQANLYASAHNIRNTLALGPDDRCLNVMPLFHIHGLMAALLASIAGGASVVCSPGFLAPRFFEWIDACAPTWYTAVPTIHQSVLERAADNTAIIERRRLRLIRSSSAALAPPVMAALEAAFGAPVIEAYGMTEASHQMASNPLPPRPRKPGSVGPAAGPAVAILDERGTLLPPTAVGEVVIRGGTVTPGYQKNPAANDAAFVDGWFRTGDQGYLDEDGYLYLTGRLKELINRGGEKIAPREVDEALLAHPDVAEAVAFGVPDPALGEDVAAAVVIRAGQTVDELALRMFAATRLADFKVPRQIAILDAIPKGATGKIQRIGMAERLGMRAVATPAATAQYQAPATAIEQQLAELWQDVMARERVGVNDSFLAIGGDSMLAAQLLERVRSAFGVDVSLIAFFAAPTIAAQAVVIEQTLAADDDVLALLDEVAGTEEDASGRPLD